MVLRIVDTFQCSILRGGIPLVLHDKPNTVRSHLRGKAGGGETCYPGTQPAAINRLLYGVHKFLCRTIYNSP